MSAKSKWTSRNIEVQAFYREFLEKGNLNLRPPYQRQQVWTPAHQCSYMESVASELTTWGNFTIARLKGKLSECIDGQNRGWTIKALFENKAKIHVESEDGGKPKNVTLAELERLGEKSGYYQEFYEKIVRANVSVSEAFNLSRADRVEAFTRLNSGIPLSREERVFGENWVSKALFDHIHSKVETGIYQLSGRRNNNRGKVFEEMAKLYCLFFEPQKNGKKNIRIPNLNTFSPSLGNAVGMQAGKIFKFVSECTKDILGYLDDADVSDDEFEKDSNKYIEKYLTERKLNQPILRYLEIANELYKDDCITVINTKSMQGSSWWVTLYFLFYVFEQLHTYEVQSLTPGQKRTIKKAFEQYRAWLNDAPEATQNYAKRRVMYVDTTVNTHRKELDKYFPNGWAAKKAKAA